MEPHRNFADRLQEAIDAKKSCLVVGLDPNLEKLPQELTAQLSSDVTSPGWAARASGAVGLFLEGVLEAVAPFAAAAKPNVAFFERFGAAGVDCLRRVCEQAKSKGLLVIVDAKRGDIGHTAEAYAEALLGDIPDTLGPHSDSVTLNPYLGKDSVSPFLDWVRERGKGLFLLVRTSNPSASDLQEVLVGERPFYLAVADHVRGWGVGLEGESGLNPIGAVVAATAPEQAATLREVLPNTFFLVPGYGAQGGAAENLAPYFVRGGRGVVVNASRSVLYPAAGGQGGDWKQAVAQAAESARDDLEAVRRKT